MEHTEVMKKINIIIGMQALRTIKIFQKLKKFFTKINLLIKKEKNVNLKISDVSQKKIDNSNFEIH